MTKITQQIQEAMAEYGLFPPGIIVDGHKHRFSTNGRRGDRAGVYAFWDHGRGFVAGYFGDYRSDLFVKWHSKQGQQLDKAERDKVREQLQQARQKAKEERRRAAKQAAQKAVRTLAAADPATEKNPYLKTKRIKPCPELKELGKTLLVPVMDILGNIHGLQRIKSDGAKLFLTGTAVKGHFFPIQGDKSKLYICEGVATGLSIHQATGNTVYSVFNCGNLLPVAKAIRKQYPEHEIIICADNDAWTKGNPGLTKSTQAARAINARLVIPTFKDTTTKPTDFNDLACLEGIQMVREQLNKAKNPDIDIETELAKLAALSSIEYDRIRKEAARKLGVRTRILDAEVKSRRQTEHKKPEACARFPGLVDIVLVDGEKQFLYKKDNGIRIDKLVDDESGHSLAPPDASAIPFELVKGEEVLHHIDRDDDSRLYRDLVERISPISVLPSEEYYHLCAVFVCFTYLHESAPYFPYLWFFGLPERGKSRVVKALSYLSYRGIYTETLNEAFLFRFADLFRGTIAFDLCELTEKAKKRGSYDLLLTRFEKGGKVPRVTNPDKGPFKDIQYFRVDGATIIATNGEIPSNDPLRSRCIKITMPEAKGIYPNNNSADFLRDLKPRLLAFRARHAFDPLPLIEKPVAGRLGDIVHPLLCTSQLLPKEASTAIHSIIKTLEEEKMQAESESLAGRIAEALFNLKAEVTNRRLEFSKLADELNKDIPEKYHYAPQTIGRELSAMGIQRKKSNGVKQIIWDTRILESIFIRFNLTQGENVPNVPNVPNQESMRDDARDKKNGMSPMSLTDGEARDESKKTSPPTKQATMRKRDERDERDEKSKGFEDETFINFLAQAKPEVPPEPYWIKKAREDKSEPEPEIFEGEDIQEGICSVFLDVQ